MRIQMRNSESAMQCFRLETPTQVTSSRSCQSSRTTTTLTTLVEALWPSILLFRRSEENDRLSNKMQQIIHSKDGKLYDNMDHKTSGRLVTFPCLSQRREWKYRLSNIMQQCHTITNCPLQRHCPPVQDFTFHMLLSKKWMKIDVFIPKRIFWPERLM